MINISFAPIQVKNARWRRRQLLQLLAFVAALSRFIWSHSSDARSTFHANGRLWVWIWMTNRYIGCLPRKDSACLRVNFGDVLMELDLSRLTDCLAYCFGLGESEIGYIFSRVCGQNDIVLDVGANIGTTALFFAKQCVNGKVHAYEPSKSMIQVLKNNIERNNIQNIEVHPYALSDKAETAWLKVETPNNPGSAHLTADAEGSPVDIYALDENPPTTNRLDFVKIDVEGYEMKVLKGGQQLFRSHKPMIVLEINFYALERMQTAASDVYRLLTEWGYQLFILEKGKLVEFLPVLKTPIVFNLIAIHCEKRPIASALLR
jgi:FkbM family methyltransferase